MEKAIRVKILEVGPLGTCCYLAAAPNARQGVVIDPGGDGDVILRALEEAGLVPGAILLTHSHYDHIGATDEILRVYPEAEFACHEECALRVVDPERNLSGLLGHRYAAPAPTRILADGEEIEVDGLALRAHWLPGHAPGHMVYYAPAAGVLFAGDTLFASSIGRTDLPGGDSALLLRGLGELLARLPEETRIYPGHGPATTVRNERRHNPFLATDA